MQNLGYKAIVASMFLLVLWFPLFQTVGAQTKAPQNPTTEQSSDQTADEGDNLVPESGKIDKAGEKVGQKIEQFGKKASDRVGAWINTKIYRDISWLKILFCLLLVFLVVSFERMVRWLIQRKIDAIPRVEGAISLTRLILRALTQPLTLAIWVYGIYGALSPLYGHFQSPDGSNLVHLILQRSTALGGIVALFWFIYQFVNVLDARLMQWAKSTESTLDDILVPLFGKTLRIFIIILGSVIAIQNLTGVQIGPLLASLGIGGIAVALAAKDSIANFFGTLTILLDKPFQVGDRIIIDSYDGTVESVGFRSTRIRTLPGNLVTIPNERLVNSGLENVSKRPHIRWLNNIGITYDTPPEKIEKAVAIIRDILADHEGMHPDFPPRAIFNGFNDWSLNILVVAWYHPPEWWDYQAWVQRTCLEITRQFNAEGINFAFPTQTLHLANDDKRQIKLELLNRSEDGVA